MKSKTAAGEIKLAASVAGEDLCVGDDVAILNQILEFPSFLWDYDAAILSPHEWVRIPRAARGAGTPFRVRAICLPFVFLKAPNGKSRTVDIRQVQLVRLDKSYAKLVRKALRRRKSPRAME